MEKPFIEISGEDFMIAPFGITAPAGYESPPKFPHCCEFHMQVLTNSIDFFAKFPNCCAPHKKFGKSPLFNKTMYTGLPLKIVNQLLYTEYHISNHINDEDWFNEITDYIEYQAMSFGTPSIGLHVYLGSLRHYVRSNGKGKNKEYPKPKRRKLEAFIDEYYKPIKPNTETVSFNVLYETYQKWVKTFPFETSYFKDLKDNFAKRFPILSGEVKVNRYTGLAKVKVLTSEQLVDHLFSTTQLLLKTVDSRTLVNEGKVTNVEKQQIQIAGEKHNLTLQKLFNKFTTGEDQYVDFIRVWLEGEAAYFREVAPLLKKQETIIMPKNFDTEIRSTHDKSYLKVFVADQSRLSEIMIVLNGLSSVLRVNSTDSVSRESPSRNLTVYPQRVYSIEEVKKEVDFTLTNLFAGGPIDPSFDKEILSKLSERAYSQIIERIQIFGKNLEKFPRIHEGYDEESFRDYFLPHLNSISTHHSGTGEAFNKKGKTDILIQDREGNNNFIGECKIWKGQSELNDAIDQLLGRYVTWRDEKVAIILFNKTVKGFSDVIVKAVETLKAHRLFESYAGPRNDTSHSFIFRHPDDPAKKVKLELILFNCTS